MLCYTDTMLSPDPPGHRPARPAYQIAHTLRVTHSLNYRYPAPVRDVSTRLRLLPPPVRGAQRLVDGSFHLAPLPIASQRHIDPFGNVLLEVRHEKVWQHLTLVFTMEVETAATYAADGQVLPALLAAAEGVPPQGADLFREPTALTTPDAALEEALRETLLPLPDDPARRAWALCQRVYAAMRYRPGTTTIDTTAAEAWTARGGVCQDYAHVLLTLCRLAGLPARYVSGFLPGEGAMHAWVEVLLPGGWAALDPTHDRWVNERYVTVAVGRDYRDITPTSGTFVGSAPGPLSHRSKVESLRTERTEVERCG